MARALEVAIWRASRFLDHAVRRSTSWLSMLGMSALALGLRFESYKPGG